MNEQTNSIGRRVTVVGVTGSGKTTMAARLADYLHCQHIELDAIHWGPNWTPLPREPFREQVAQIVAGECWVTDGNYSAVRDLVLARAETVVWLDYPLLVILWRLVRRTTGRVIFRTELWQGNRENWRSQLGRDSLFLWALQTFRKRRKAYGTLAADPAMAYLQIIRLRSTRATRQWLRSLGVDI